MFWSLYATISYTENPQILLNRYIKLKTNSSMVHLPYALEIATARRLGSVVCLASSLSKGKVWWREVISMVRDWAEMTYHCWVPHGQNSVYTIVKLLHHWTQLNLHEGIFYLVFEERIQLTGSKWGAIKWFLCPVLDKKHQTWIDLFALMMNKWIKNTQQTKSRCATKIQYESNEKILQLKRRWMKMERAQGLPFKNEEILRQHLALCFQ